MVFFNQETRRNDALLGDLQQFLNELTEIEAKHCVIDQTKVDEIANLTTKRLPSSSHTNPSNQEDIDMLMEKVSFEDLDKNEDEPVQLSEHCCSSSESCCCEESKRECVSEYQTLQTAEKTDNRIVKFEYDFNIEKEFEKLEKQLLCHNVCEALIIKLRNSFLTQR